MFATQTDMFIISSCACTVPLVCRLLTASPAVCHSTSYCDALSFIICGTFLSPIAAYYTPPFHSTCSLFSVLRITSPLYVICSIHLLRLIIIIYIVALLLIIITYWLLFNPPYLDTSLSHACYEFQSSSTPVADRGTVALFAYIHPCAYPVNLHLSPMIYIATCNVSVLTTTGIDDYIHLTSPHGLQ